MKCSLAISNFLEEISSLFHSIVFLFLCILHWRRDFPIAQMIKNLPVVQETWVQSLGWEDPLERKWQSTPVFLPGESHGQRSLAGYSPWGHKESDTTKWLTHTLKKAFLPLLAFLWNSAFRWVYLSLSPLPLASRLFSATCKASSENHFAFLKFFFLGDGFDRCHLYNVMILCS